MHVYGYVTHLMGEEGNVRGLRVASSMICLPLDFQQTHELTGIINKGSPMNGNKHQALPFPKQANSFDLMTSSLQFRYL